MLKTASQAASNRAPAAKTSAQRPAAIGEGGVPGLALAGGLIGDDRIDDRVLVADDFGLEPALLADPRAGDLGRGVEKAGRGREAVDVPREADQALELQAVVLLHLVVLPADRPVVLGPVPALAEAEQDLPGPGLLPLLAQRPDRGDADELARDERAQVGQDEDEKRPGEQEDDDGRGRPPRQGRDEHAQAQKEGEVKEGQGQDEREAPEIAGRESDVRVEEKDRRAEERHQEEGDGQAEEVAQPFAGEDLGPGHGAAEQELQRPLLAFPADLIEAEEESDERQDDPDDVEEIRGGEERVDDVPGRLAGPDVDAGDADLEGAGHGVVEALGEDRQGVRGHDRDGRPGLGPDELVVGHPPGEIPVHDEQARGHEQDHEEEDDEELIAEQVRDDLFAGDGSDHPTPPRGPPRIPCSRCRCGSGPRSGALRGSAP